MMGHLIATSSYKKSLLSTHKVLKNTYFLLSLTLAFSALTATVNILFNLPTPGPILMLVCVYGLMFLTHRLANRSTGILAVFSLTGFIGYTLGPLLNMFLFSGAGQIIMISLSGTALIFFCCSTYVLISKKDLSFLSGIMMVGFTVLLMSVIANFFLQISALSLAISAMFILFSTGTILLEINNIINGGEKNYIRATVGLYVSLYNIFVSLLKILSGMRNH